MMMGMVACGAAAAGFACAGDFPFIAIRNMGSGAKNPRFTEAIFAANLHPGVALSKNTVSTFHKNGGKLLSMIVRFMRNRAAKLGEGDHVLVDGTLKTNISTVNSLSDFSRKARIKGGCGTP